VDKIKYVGPVLTREMIAKNRRNLAGLSGKKVEVYYDPDEPEAGAWVMDPNSGEPVYLTPENRIHPFDTGALAEEMERKRTSIKAVTGAFRDTAAAAGKILTSPEYRSRVEARDVVQKAIADKAAREATVSAMSEEDFFFAVGARLVREKTEAVRRQRIYPTPAKRYQAILDAVLRGDDLSPQDRLYKANYENRMGPEEKIKWQIYVKFNSPAPGAKE
jgi:putative transposase